MTSQLQPNLKRDRALEIGAAKNHERKGLLFARGYFAASGDASPGLRRARAIARALREYPVVVHADALLVGKPVCNDLTSLILAAMSDVGLVNPNVAICYRPEMPDELLARGLECIGRGLSHPAFYNDRIITGGLIRAGVNETDARQYQNSTCVEITPIGRSNVQVARIWIFAAKAMELLVAGGRQLIDEPELAPGGKLHPANENCELPMEQGGFRAPPLDTFEAFRDAYATILSRLINKAISTAIAEAEHWADHGSSPLVSCFTNDCIARGLDACQGGARYNDQTTLTVGFATAVDALAAVRDIVFRRKLITLDQLREALRANFSGHESLRRQLLGCPKYGNDDPAADSLACWLYELLGAEHRKYTTPLGGRFWLGIFSGWDRHPHTGKRCSRFVGRGVLTGATPDGRLAGQPLSENIGPALGADRRGITAVLNSATKMDHRFGLGGLSLNCRLDRRALTAPADQKKTVALLRTFMQEGGFQVQFNALDTQTLRDAQKNPERYRSLTVRIAGYSDYFRSIDPALQEEIIQRTTQSLP